MSPLTLSLSFPARPARMLGLVAVALALAPVAVRGQGKSASDLSPPARRAATVDLAARLAANPEISPPARQDRQSFQPRQLGCPDPEEQRLAFEAAENAHRAGLAAQSPARPATPSSPSPTPSRPSGVVQVGGQPNLLIRRSPRPRRRLAHRHVRGSPLHRRDHRDHARHLHPPRQRRRNHPSHQIRNQTMRTRSLILALLVAAALPMLRSQAPAPGSAACRTNPGIRPRPRGGRPRR
jgi:hypothetical protein